MFFCTTRKMQGFIQIDINTTRNGKKPNIAKGLHFEKVISFLLIIYFLNHIDFHFTDGKLQLKIIQVNLWK